MIAAEGAGTAAVVVPRRVEPGVGEVAVAQAAVVGFHLPPEPGHLVANTAPGTVAERDGLIGERQAVGVELGEDEAVRPVGVGGKGHIAPLVSVLAGEAELRTDEPRLRLVVAGGHPGVVSPVATSRPRRTPADGLVSVRRTVSSASRTLSTNPGTVIEPAR